MSAESIVIGVDLACLRHDTGEGHAERPARLEVAQAAIDAEEARGVALRRLAPRLATRDELGLVHPGRHVDQVADASADSSPLDADTPVSPESFECAQRAAGLSLDAVREVVTGAARRAFVATRPPGHHASAGRAMGFCLMNNVALAARWARQAGLERVAIVDFDVHHGNGTQAIFDDDPSVLFISTHQRPGYPGTGRERDLGVGAGVGSTLNCPLPPGTGDGPVVAFYDQVASRVLDAFAPQLILVSAGYDLMAGDPLGGLSVTVDGVRAIASRLVAAAERTAEGRIVFLLEGGYDLDNLAAGVRATVAELATAGRPNDLPMWDTAALGPVARHLPAWRTALTL